MGLFRQTPREYEYYGTSNDEKLPHDKCVRIINAAFIIWGIVLTVLLQNYGGHLVRRFEYLASGQTGAEDKISYSLSTFGVGFFVTLAFLLLFLVVGLFILIILKNVLKDKIGDLDDCLKTGFVTGLLTSLVTLILCLIIPFNIFG